MCGLFQVIPHSIEKCAFLEGRKRNSQPWVLYIKSAGRRLSAALAKMLALTKYSIAKFH